METVKEAVLEQKIDDLSARFDQVDARFDRVDARFDQVDARFDRVDARFNRSEERFEQAEIRNRKEHDQIRSELRAEFRSEVGGLRIEMSEGFRDLREMMAQFNRTVIWILGSIVGAVIAGIAVATAATIF